MEKLDENRISTEIVNSPDLVVEINTKNQESEKTVRAVIRELLKAGFEVAVRAGTESSLFLLVKAPAELVLQLINKDRTCSFLYGSLNDVENVRIYDIALVDSSDRIRILYEYITGIKKEKCLGIVPSEEPYKNLVDIYPLHNSNVDQKWMSSWRFKSFLKIQDLDKIKSEYGSQIALHFAFQDTFRNMLGILAVWGILGHYLFQQYSVVYSIGMSIWGICFIQLWKYKESQLSRRWSTNYSEYYEKSREEFHPSTVQVNNTSGTLQSSYPHWKMVLRSLITTAPLFIVSGIILFILISIAFSFDVTLTEVYSGPFKPVVGLLPALIFQILTLPFNIFYTVVAEKLTAWENQRTKNKYQSSLGSKIFLQHFMLSYTALILISYVYGPFGEHLISNVLQNKAANMTMQLSYITDSKFKLNPLRLRNQYFYFLTNAQVINYFTTLAVPQIISYLKSFVKSKFSAQRLSIHDNDAEAKSLNSIRKQSELSKYDEYNDYKDLVLIFGYLVMFSPIYPLAPLIMYVNSYLMVRSSVYKLCKLSKRPVAARIESIKDWNQRLTFISWMGSITMPSISYLYSPLKSLTKQKLYYSLLVGFFSEHLWFLLRHTISSLCPIEETPSLLLQEREQLLHGRIEEIMHSVGHLQKTNPFEESSEVLALYRSAEFKKTI
ncbi:anoctamin calcium-activated chloride channel OR Ca(2+)-activated phospholipid scramblase [Schizosaccharomyces osmophilus]|uniref:Anoctamin calcium-activated chloride channel OR Ca(2+)-activated phospholipid scramblase n=1 Tax=Schizosaccharomyces osmophilus TaxID=2545709 RepID=A0AAE9W6B3_9SCHI|nr:anoctamin calcium-activated chloride channel OR Ca(2+)-activated phospholipid scramblase [Schizosaccharomyces osmophilus]WBW70871.1 anoctamin calcium-activated chloride channel OR Ca(2+)-activated phospholipid scramblase [Schizosaccharomyces osmophilus]